MENILLELASVQGLIGAYIYQSPGTILHNTLPAVFKPVKLLNMGKALVRIHGAGALNFPDLSDVVLTFEESTVVTRSIAEKTWLIILGEPDLNANLVTLSVNLLMEELKEGLEKRPGAEQAEPSAPMPVPAASGSPAPRPNDLLERGPLAPTLQAMQGAMAKVLGPMAKIIFLECLDQWLLRQAPSHETLPELTEIVVREIADQDKIGKYLKLMDSMP